MTAMTPEELVTLLRAEEADAASFHQSEMAAAQQEALDRFYGRPYGDEEPNRSKVVIRDLETTINWLMPDLMRIFRSRDELISVKALSAEDDAPYLNGKTKVDVMAAYLGVLLFDDNDGMTAIHDFTFDGLLMRLGVMKVGWEDPQPKPPQLLQGVSVEALTKYMSDPEYSILEAAPSANENDGDETADEPQTEFGETGAEAGADEGVAHEQGEQIPGMWDLKVQHKPRMGRLVVEAVPSEEFAIERTARSIQTAKYHRRKSKRFVADLIRMFPDKEQELRERKTGNTSDLFADNRAVARNPEDVKHGEPSNTKGREECDLLEEYVRVDFDGDGVVELRCVKRVENVILENEMIERSEYVTWTPGRVAHRLAGRSLYDVLGDLQKIRTVITRRFLDALGQTVTPRTYVNTRALGADATGTMQAIAANDIGGVIPVDGDPRQAVLEAVTPDVSGPALNALQHFSESIAEVSGVTKQAQGMDPEAMNKTATGIDLLQAAAKVRIELIATWLGKAIEDVLKLALHTVVAHQDGARQVKLFGKFAPVDPRRWSDEHAVSVHVGSAGVSRQQRLANLAMIAQKQEQVLLTAGPQNPLVTLQHLRATYAEMVGNMGFRDTDVFFGQIPDGWQPPEPPPDPKVAAEQQKLQLEQAKAQNGAQVEAAKMQHQQALSEAEFQHKTRLAELDAQTQREIAMAKLASERELAQLRLASEQQLARERMDRELEMARIKSDREHDLALKKHDNETKLNGFRPGGALDA